MWKYCTKIWKKEIAFTFENFGFLTRSVKVDSHEEQQVLNDMEKTAEKSILLHKNLLFFFQENWFQLNTLQVHPGQGEESKDNQKLLPDLHISLAPQQASWKVKRETPQAVFVYLVWNFIISAHNAKCTRSTQSSSVNANFTLCKIHMCIWNLILENILTKCARNARWGSFRQRFILFA